MRQSRSVDWDAIKAAYVFGGGTRGDIAKRFRISEDSLRKRIQRENWKELRDEETDARNRQAKAIIAGAEAVKAARLMMISERVADKLEQCIDEMGRFYTVKRKSRTLAKYDAPEDDETEALTGPVVVEEETTLSVEGKSPIRSADIKALASALRDLREVIRADKGDDSNSGDITVTWGDGTEESGV